MAVQFAADVQDVAAAHLLRDGARAELIIQGLGGHESPVSGLILRGSVLPSVAPVGIAVPVDETDQGIVNFIHEPPRPIPPEVREALYGWSANQRLTAAQVRI